MIGIPVITPSSEVLQILAPHSTQKAAWPTTMMAKRRLPLSCSCSLLHLLLSHEPHPGLHESGYATLRFPSIRAFDKRQGRHQPTSPVIQRLGGSGRKDEIASAYEDGTRLICKSASCSLSPSTDIPPFSTSNRARQSYHSRSRISQAIHRMAPITISVI